MKYSGIVNRIDRQGVNAWAIHEKAREMAQQGEEVILLSIGDPDFDTPEPIVDRAIQSLRDGRTHYTPLFGVAALRDAIAAYHTRYSEQAVTAENVCVVQGGQCGLFAAAMCILEAGDEVIIPEPMYTTYGPVIGATGATIVNVPLRPERNFQIDPDEVARAVTPKTRAILINTPHNPTGAVIHREELEAIAAIARQHDLWIITDEVYGRITYDYPHINPATLPHMSERCTSVSSLSKTHAMTGWRLGWVVGPTELTNHIGRMLACMLFGLAPFIQDAAIEALTHCVDETDHMRAIYRRRRDLVCKTLEGIPGLSFNRPEGGIYVLLDVRKSGMSASDFAYGLLAQERVALLLGEGFGPSLVGHLRLSLTVPDHDLLEACRRIGRFMKSR